MHKPVGLPKKLADLNRTAIMGVLNVTPDSFSDGGLYATTDLAIKHGLELVRQGADIVDVGGESTRPGAQRVTLDEELSRVIPVIEKLVEAGVSVSVDTMRSHVAEQALTAGAHLINDVSAGLADEDMFGVVKESNVPYIMMHWRAHSIEMNEKTEYTNVVTEVIDELKVRVDSAVSAGISPDRLVLDPGIGFAKLPEQNWPILRHIDEFMAEGFPTLIGVSRKRFIGELLADASGPREVDSRDYATTALTTLLAQANLWAIRVHNVQAAHDAIAVVEALRNVHE